MKKDWFKNLVLLLLLLCLIVPVYSGGQKEQEEEKTVGEVKDNKDLFVFACSEPLTGSWELASHTALSQVGIEHHLFDKIFMYPMREESPDTRIYGLGTGFEFIDENTLEVTLRENVTFHDGKPFSADDVVATVNHYSNPDMPGFGYLPGLVETKKIDEYTVQFVADYPISPLLFFLANVSIASADDIKSGAFKERPNGTGPWVFEKQDGDTTILKANENYWAGPPKLKEFHWAYVPNASTRLFGLLSGDYDAIERVETEHIPSIEDDPSTEVSMATLGESKWFMFRCHKPPFDNAKVRRALAHAIDREGVRDIMGVAGVEAESHLSPVMFGSTPVENNIPFDPEMTKQLLKEAGYNSISDFPPFEYITSTGFYPKTKEYAEYITAVLTDLGFKVNLRVLETAPWGEALYNPEAGNIIDTGWCPSMPDPDYILRVLFHKDNKRVSFLDDDEVSASLDKERSMTDVEKRRAVLQNETLPLLMEKVPGLPLFHSVMIYGYNSDLKNFRATSSAFFYLKDMEEPFGENDVYK